MKGWWRGWRFIEADGEDPPESHLAKLPTSRVIYRKVHPPDAEAISHSVHPPKGG